MRIVEIIIDVRPILFQSHYRMLRDADRSTTGLQVVRRADGHFRMVCSLGFCRNFNCRTFFHQMRFCDVFLTT